VFIPKFTSEVKKKVRKSYIKRKTPANGGGFSDQPDRVLNPPQADQKPSYIICSNTKV
jgi:hypothetical protein